MPIFGLPKVVESAVNSLLESSHVSSWKLTGGDKYATITLRFNMEGGSLGIHGTQTYRKKAPSQVNRDTKRQQERMRKVEMEVTQDHSSMDENNGLNNECSTVQNTCTGEVTQLQSLAVKDPDIRIDCEIDSESDMSAGSEISTGAEQSPTYTTQNKLTAATVDTPYENNNPVISQTLPQTDYKSPSSDQDVSVSGSGAFRCNICDKSLTGSWKRCTSCNIFNICDTCYATDEHSHHETQIQGRIQDFDKGGGPPKKNFSLASLGMNSFQITTK